MNGIRGMRAGAAALALGTALAGCGDLLGTENRKPDEPGITFDEPGIYPVLVVARQTADSATLELHLKRVRVTERVASFQGELTFNAATLALGGVRVADGITGATNERKAGTLRFAGVATSGIDGSQVLSLSFATHAPVTAESFELNVEEIVASDDFMNLAPRLQMQGRHPRLTRTPLQ